MQGYGIVGSMKDFYWDIRPKPEYGTIEIRICDTPLTVEQAARLAAYAQTLSAELLEHRQLEPVEPLYRVYGYNRFQACRFGFEAALVDPYARAHVNLREDLLATLDRLLPRSVALGTTAALRELAATAREDRSDSAWLRAQYAATRSMPDVVREQALRWREDEPAGTADAK
jgi:carboxylate-amine ligase